MTIPSTISQPKQQNAWECRRHMAQPFEADGESRKGSGDNKSIAEFSANTHHYPLTGATEGRFLENPKAL